jgi:putative cofactor-binding repeat protein
VTPRTFLVLAFLVSAVALIAHAQTVSPDGSSITPQSGGSLVTTDGTWTLSSQTNAGGNLILLNGQTQQTAPYNAAGIILEIAQGQIYDENAQGLWFVWQGGAWVQTTQPQTSGGSGTGTTSCSGTLTNYYQPNIATPTGYGASYDLFTPQHELEVSVQNCPANSTTLTVGSNQSNQYVYNKGYLYQSGSWQSISLTGSGLVSNAWYPQIASASLGTLSPSSWEYVVGYVCAWNGAVWQCGCANTACTTNYWQLQAFQSQSSGGGSNGSGAGGQWGGTPDASAIVISPNGSDSNPCTVSSPCQTLDKAQQMARSASDKMIYLRAGTYNRSQTITLDGNDNGESWMTYPGDAVDSAVLDGGNTVDLFSLNGPSNITFNGLKLQHVYDGAILTIAGRSDSITIENCDIGFNQHTSFAGSWNPMIVLSNTTNGKILNNYVHDAASQGIALFAYGPGDSIDGSIIKGNVVLNAVQQMNDGGAIYIDMRNTNVNGGHITIANNFVRDYGGPGITNATGIYLDDDTSNAAITGNVIGPGAPGTGSPTATIINGGCCNTFSGNIMDLGLGANGLVAGWSAPGGGGALYFNWTSPNIVQGNVIISNYTGSTQTSLSGIDGQEYVQGPGYPTSMGTVMNNVYFNYGGGAVTTTGNIVSDSNPIHVDPQISGYLYAIAQGSPVYNSPVNFPPIKGGWGPPGFAIPSSSNHSDP